MNARQKTFCREFTIDSNGKQAAIRAGYSEKTAAAQASRLLIKVNVRKRIDDLFAEHRKRIDITRDSLTELFQDDRDLAHKHAQAGAAVSATDKLAKLHGLMVERSKIDVSADISNLSEAERDAELDEVNRELVLMRGRPFILERIANWEQLLAEFDTGAFDDRLERGVVRSDAPLRIVSPDVASNSQLEE